VDFVAKALISEEKIPDEFRKRLQRYGYIKVDTGILTADRFASAAQIADVTDDRVDLNVTKDELIVS
jgi:histidyl-tRNA synthetase